MKFLLRFMRRFFAYYLGVTPPRLEQEPELQKLGRDELRQAFSGFQILDEKIVPAHKGPAVEVLAARPI